MVINSGLKMADLVLAASWAIHIGQMNRDGFDAINEAVLQMSQASVYVACQACGDGPARGCDLDSYHDFRMLVDLFMECPLRVAATSHECFGFERFWTDSWASFLCSAEAEREGMAYPLRGGGCCGSRSGLLNPSGGGNSYGDSGSGMEVTAVMI